MGKIAVVTGGASGIGRAIVSRLAASGMDVALLDLDRAKAEAAAREVAVEGRRVAAYVADVSDLDAVRAAREQVVQDLGPPSVVVNAAGWSEIQAFMDNDAGFWRKAIDVNLLGPIAVTRVFLDDVIASGEGRVINIASDAGRVGSTGEVVYSAAKGGVMSFTKALAREMARHRVTVNCVCPGPTATPMLLVQDPKRVEALTKAIPFRRLAEPADIAQAVSYFASDDASYVTGQILSVSGGLTMAG